MISDTLSKIILSIIGVITIGGFIFIWYKITKSENTIPTIIEKKIPESPQQ